MFKKIMFIALFVASLTSVANAESVLLQWTAPGDDGTIGTATTYDLRTSASLITSANFNLATVVAGLSAPQVAGSNESFTVAGLAPGTHYFAIKAVDEAGNWSLISNVVSVVVVDTTPPAAIVDLR
jgi:chitodextrinase